jgi:hypothetical protein
MAKGVQTKRPASRYFLIGIKDLLDLKNQWQAQPVAQPPDEAEAVGAADALGAAELLEAVSVLLVLWLAESLPVVEAAAAVPAAAAGAAVPPEPPLKSVAYQPEPLS